MLDAPRGDIDVFEQTPFITGVVNGRVTFDWRGRHDVLFDDITPADVRWICGRLQRSATRSGTTRSAPAAIRRSTPSVSSDA